MFTPWYWIDWLVDGHPRRAVTAMLDHRRVFSERPRPHLRASVLGLLNARRVPAPDLPDWLVPDLAQRTDVAERVRAHHRRSARATGRQSLTEDPCWETWLTWGDPSFNGVPLRTRHPFMDLRLINFVAGIPPYPWLVDKRVLRDATIDLLPERVRRRPKTPLVASPRRGTEQASLRRLAEFVGEVPRADRFIDRSRLAADLLTWNGAAQTRRNWSFGPALGLVHWLAHRTVPRTE
jgi:asparagine synthase (glutamine-hydrolysing)